MGERKQACESLKPKAMKPPKERIRRSKTETVIVWSVCIFFAVYAFTLVYPFYYLLINSFKTNLKIRLDPFGLPEKWLFKNYVDVFNEYNIGEMFYNSITLTMGVTIGSILLSCMTAYVLAKYQFKGNSTIYSFVIIASVIPTMGALSATYRLMVNTGLIETYVGMLLMQCGGFGGQFLYLHSYFKSVPWTYAESAMLDGASDFRIFTTIMLPLVKNGIIAFTIIRFIGFWNEYWTPYMFYSNHPTLAVGLNALSMEAQNTGSYAKMFAAMIISVVPILIFYAVFQKKLMSNAIGGGIKE